MSKKKKILLIIGIVLAIFFIIIFAAITLLGNAADSLKASFEDATPLQMVEERDLSSVIYTSGTVASQKRVAITTELTGKVKELYVQLGDYVEAGMPLFVIDDSELRKKIDELEKQLSDQDILKVKQKEINERALNNARAEQNETLASARQAVNEAQAQLDAANQLLSQAQQNYQALAAHLDEPEAAANAAAEQTEAQNGVNTAKQALTEAQNAYNTAVRTTNEQIQAAQDTIDTQSLGNTDTNEASATLADLYRQLDQVTVFAPQSGIITSLNISVGSIVTTGDLMVIEDNKNLKITVSLSETEVLKVTKGMHVNIKANALEDVEMQGTVGKVINFAGGASDNTQGMAYMGDMGSGAGTSYSAEIIVEGETQLLLGMNAKAEIVLTEKKEALSVAYDSILTDEDGKSYVFAAEYKDTEGTYKTKKIFVTPGEEGDYYTEISSDKLKSGMLVVMFPDTVKEGEILTNVEILDGEGNAAESSGTETVIIE